MVAMAPYVNDTLNTQAASYECWECPWNPFCISVSA